MSSDEICEEMKQHWEVFLENHDRFNEKKVFNRYAPNSYDCNVMCR